MAAGLESIRADFEPSGGFIHKPMLERLIVAERDRGSAWSQRPRDSLDRRGKVP